MSLQIYNLNIEKEQGIDISESLTQMEELIQSKIKIIEAFQQEINDKDDITQKTVPIRLNKQVILLI